MALIKLVLIFLLSQVCIIVFFSVTTSSNALPYPAGAGRGTLDCDHFIETTNQIDDDGELSGRSYIYRSQFSTEWFLFQGRGGQNMTTQRCNIFHGESRFLERRLGI